MCLQLSVVRFMKRKWLCLTDKMRHWTFSGTPDSRLNSESNRIWRIWSGICCAPKRPRGQNNVNALISAIIQYVVTLRVTLIRDFVLFKFDQKFSLAYLRLGIIFWMLAKLISKVFSIKLKTFVESMKISCRENSIENAKSQMKQCWIAQTYSFL